MKFISLAALSAALVMVSACNIDGYINTYFEKPYNGPGGGSGDNGNSLSNADYMATVGFEPDYDWRRQRRRQAPTISPYRMRGSSQAGVRHCKWISRIRIGPHRDGH